jgi:tetratricopeptide (TPR) repeat protein
MGETLSEDGLTMKFTRLPIIAGLSILLTAMSAQAANSGSEPPPPPPGQRDYYAEGLTAIDQQDWKTAIELLSKVVEQRPWHDDGHNLLGFAYRKQGHYDQALQHYHQALELNPYHRGALEYLGEALLEMGKPEQAGTMLERLAEACRRSNSDAATAAVTTGNCPEWEQLNRAIEQQRTQTAAGSAESGSSWSSSAPSNIDTSTERLSAQQHFRASYHSKTDPIPLNRMHSWVLQLQTADGKPLENAAIAIAGGMPEHDHGLPSAPQVTRYLGNGAYLLEGMKFHMNGWWQLKFRIETADQSDDITFDLML